MTQVDQGGASPTAIELRALTKSFGRRIVLDGLDLTIERGRVCALLGRNGSGKSTLIRILAGLIGRDSGSCAVLGLDPCSGSARIRERIGFVSEEMTFYPWMRVRELLAFVGSFHRNWDETHVAALVARLGLPPEAPVSQLSRGLKGKLALVAALGHRPELFLLDEPMAGLDPVVRREFLAETIELLSQEARTVLIVTHLITDIEKLADTVAVLDRGRIVLSGELEAVKARFSRVRAVFPGDVPSDLEKLGRPLSRLGQEVLLLVEGPAQAAEGRLVELGARSVEVSGVGLEELFCAITRP